MKINEITNTLKMFVAKVKVNGTSIKTSITAENSTHARLLFQKLYGAANVSNLSEASELEETGAGTRVMSAGELQVKSLADQEVKIKQQKKQLQARQTLAKAQEKVRQSLMPPKNSKL
jgi:hypothetical protein